MCGLGAPITLRTRRLSVLPFSSMSQTDAEQGERRFARYAWWVLAYNLLVILWGAVVRATGSGAGCGDHWPLCEGQVIPHAKQIATLIEFAHRATSGVDVVLVAALVYLAFRRFARGQAVRRYALGAALFTVTEGLLGAALVLYGEVGKNASTGRVFILSLHLVNTFMLLASIALAAWAAGGLLAEIPRGRALRPSTRTQTAAVACAAALAGTLALAVSGTIAALADTLFPASSLIQGLSWDFSGATNPIVHLRIIHPALGLVVGGYLLILAAHVLNAAARTVTKKLARWLMGLVLLQFCLGVLNILLMAPLWTQIVHLLTADLIWIVLVLLAAEILGGQRTLQPGSSPDLAAIAGVRGG